MDCMVCAEPVGVATIFCQHCGARLQDPVLLSSSVEPFDRGHWAVLPPLPPDAPADAIVPGIELLLSLLDL